jgi:ABC-2 type transport system ATP-binding protein
VALEVNNVTKRFGDKIAVQDLNFKVERGQVFGLLGLNGAGKSTTIRIILNILQPDEGTVAWNGRPAEGAHHRFGYLPEERGLYPQMKVWDHLVWYGRVNGMDKAAAQRAADQWMERFDISMYKTKTVSELSKGNQQKVQFIMAVLHRPELLILDEPFSGLDPVNTTVFKEVFRDIAASGTTILFSSHRLDHVEELSDAVGIIHHSRMVVNGTVEELLTAEPPRQLRISGRRGAAAGGRKTLAYSVRQSHWGRTGCVAAVRNLARCDWGSDGNALGRRHQHLARLSNNARWLPHLLCPRVSLVRHAVRNRWVLGVPSRGAADGARTGAAVDGRVVLRWHGGAHQSR